MSESVPVVPIVASAPGAIILGDRSFTVLNQRTIPFRIDAAQHALVHSLGLDHPELQPDPDEDPVRYIGRVQGAVIGSGKIPELLGHYLLPLGKTEADWSAEMAAETARHISHQVTVEREREVCYELAAEFVWGFFLKGAAWLKSSQSFLDLSNLAVGMSLKSDAERWRSIRGRPWFAKLRDSITIARWRSRAGRSVRD